MNCKCKYSIIKTVKKESDHKESSLFRDETHQSNLLEGLQELKKNGQFCDATLVVGEKLFPVHKNLLVSLSPYFKAMFTTNFTEVNQDMVTLDGVEESAMELLLDYVYTGILSINSDNVQSLLSAATFLQFDTMKEIASAFLGQQINTTNCIGIHCFAEYHSCLALADKAKKFILQNFQRVCEEDEFLNLRQDKLIEFIKCDEIKIEKEEDVFKAVMKWFSKEPDARKIDLCKVLQNVRFPLMSPYFLYGFVKSTPVIQNCFECMKLVEEALTFHLLPDRRIKNQTQRTRERVSAAKVEVIVAVGGTTNNDRMVESLECYIPSTKNWFNLCKLPSKVSNHGLVVSGENFMYLVGVRQTYDEIKSSVFRYDPILNVWQEMAPMLSSRTKLGLAMLDGCVYAVGGWVGKDWLKSVEKYDVTNNSWRVITHMEMALKNPACVAHDGMLYVAGVGASKSSVGIFQRYDPISDEWVTLSPMQVPRCESGACVLDGFIYIMGGSITNSENTSTVERYDIQNDKWEFVASMCEVRSKPGVAVVGSKIFVLGGNYHNKTIECYDSEANTWTIYDTIHSAKIYFACVPLQIKKSHLIKKNY